MIWTALSSFMIQSTLSLICSMSSGFWFALSLSISDRLLMKFVWMCCSFFISSWVCYISHFWFSRNLMWSSLFIFHWVISSLSWSTSASWLCMDYIWTRKSDLAASKWLAWSYCMSNCCKCFSCSYSLYSYCYLIASIANLCSFLSTSSDLRSVSFTLLFSSLIWAFLSSFLYTSACRCHTSSSFCFAPRSSEFYSLTFIMSSFSSFYSPVTTPFIYFFSISAFYCSNSIWSYSWSVSYYSLIRRSY